MPLREGGIKQPGLRPLFPGEGAEFLVTFDNAQFKDATPDSGIARYEFEQTVDDTWNGNTGTDSTSAGYTTNSEVGEYSKSFDGADGQVTVSSIQFDDTEDFSVAGYFYISSSGGDGTRGLVSQRDSNSTADWAVWLNDSNFNLNFGAGESLGTVNIGSNDGLLSTSTWFFFAATKGGDTYTLYFNDANQIGQQTGSSGWSTSDTFRVGALNDGSEVLNGNIDDLRVYGKELTATEVSNLYNGGSI